MKRPVLIWNGSRSPTAAELRAIAGAYRAGLVRDGDRLAPGLVNPQTAGEAQSAARSRSGKLKYELREARKQSRADVGQVRRQRAASRPQLAAEVRQYRAEWRDRINAQVAAMRSKHADDWQRRIAAARLPTLEAAAKLEAERESERGIRKSRRAERAARQAEPKSRRVAAIHKAESDYEVEGNIDPELVPIWRKVKNRIRTTGTRATRTEAFLEWVDANTDEVERMRAELFDPDDYAAELEAQEFARYAEAG